jgi:hypothetical protein
MNTDLIKGTNNIVIAIENERNVRVNHTVLLTTTRFEPALR